MRSAIPALFAVASALITIGPTALADSADDRRAYERRQQELMDERRREDRRYEEQMDQRLRDERVRRLHEQQEDERRTEEQRRAHELEQRIEAMSGGQANVRWIESSNIRFGIDVAAVHRSWTGQFVWTWVRAQPQHGDEWVFIGAIDCWRHLQVSIDSDRGIERLPDNLAWQPDTGLEDARRLLCK